MLKKISKEIKQILASFPEEDFLYFNNQKIKIKKENFRPLFSPRQRKKPQLAFLDGGQAEIISTACFSLFFIRVFAQLFQGNKKLNFFKNEFYLLIYAQGKKEGLAYCSRIFPLGEKLIEEEDLSITFQEKKREEETKETLFFQIACLARRLAELSLGSRIKTDYLIFDGTLTPVYSSEEKYLRKLVSPSALAKTSSLLTISGNSPLLLLQKISPFSNCWFYFLEGKTFFVKLHPKTRYVFRFEGEEKVLPYLLENSKDPLFLGYPYGLLLADKFARISQIEKNSLKTRFLLDKNNQEVLSYLTTKDAHDVLDNLG